MTKAPTLPGAAAAPSTASIPGEVYQLGRHRLVCGDSTDPNIISRLMDGARADLLLTDPPYNVNYSSTAGAIANDNKTDPRFLHFLSAAFSAADRAMRPGAAFYIWHASSESFNFLAAARSVGWRVRQTLIWVKPTFVLSRQDYHWRHEPCLYGWKEGAAHTWAADRRQSTVLDFAKPVSSPDHPTMKPLQIFAYLIGNSTRPGEAVLDPFAGSGTTALAAERLGRRAFLAELDPKFCDVIRRRWAETVHGEGCDWRDLTAPPPTHLRGIPDRSLNQKPPDQHQTKGDRCSRDNP